MKKIAILSCVNVKHMSLISLYTEILKKNNVQYDLIYMDKYDEEEDFDCNKKYRYVNKINQKWPRFFKRIKYMMFYPYATRILKKNRYDFVIVWNDLAIFMFGSFLSRHFRDRYCLNVRDNMGYEKKQYKSMYGRAFGNSAFNTISSKGYLDILPQNTQYIQINSLNLSVLEGMQIHKRLRTKDEVIRVGFIGYVRYYERNKSLLDVFANDKRFEMHYYGKNANVLKVYAEENHISNAVFHDSFPVAETGKYLEKIDIINNLYGNDTLNVRKAISIKFFHALYARIPILVNTNTYIGELANNLGVGFYVHEITPTMKEELYTWYHSLDFTRIDNECSRYLEGAIKENEKFEKIVAETICS